MTFPLVCVKYYMSQPLETALISRKKNTVKKVDIIVKM